MKAIGPTFANELITAGLTGLPFSWGADGSFNFDALTDVQKSAVLAVYEAHDPTNQMPILQAQIDALQQKALLNRGSCELEIVTMQDLARRKVNAYLEANPDDTTPVADLILHELETTPYWVQLTALNEQLSALREQL